MRAKMPTNRVFGTHAPRFSGGAITLDQPRLSGRVGHALVALPDGRVVVAGGREYNPGFFYGLPEIDVYDPTADQWTRVAGMPPVRHDGDGGYGGRGFPGVTVLDSGQVLIFGGTATRLVEKVSDDRRVTFQIKGTYSPRTSSVVLDPVSAQVRRVGDLNVGRMFSLSPAWHEGGGAFAIGGWSVVRGQAVRAEVYDPVVESWSLLPVEPPPAVDGGPRLGTGLTDGTVLTWSVPDAPGAALVKRLHPGP
ncbi:MAG TPA: kelch repeat-containing protein [Ornithinibacter sp.]|nr:kelch repeat-containing protein [Ornithinibacter sp.]